MALTERDKNQMADKRNNGKRKKVDIDLTGDSDGETPASKTARHWNNRDTSTNGKQQQIPGASAYQTPPASSAVKSSQASCGSGSFESVYSIGRTLGDGQHSQAERDSWLADDDDDLNEIVGSTQAAAARTESLH